MDYEKAYKEAMEKVRSLHDNANEISKLIDLREELEGIFPELAESEDERIRKDIISHFTKGIEGSSFDEVREKYKIWIAWIEKQGEQKSIKVPKFKVGDFIQFKGMGHTRYTIKEVCGLSHYINTCDKLMEMSYTDANFELVEQKPAEWSEDDQSNFNELSSFILEIYRTEDASRLITWLNDIKDRVLPQPKQEWSEEDERIRQDIENLIHFALEDGSAVSPAANTTKEGSISWIQSLKDRYTWKPCDYELEVLRLAAEKDGACLMGLYEQLKKLKG